jgi:hypothetical protein
MEVCNYCEPGSHQWLGSEACLVMVVSHNRPQWGFEATENVCGCFKHWIRTRSDGRRDSDVFCVTNKLMCEKTQSLRELRSMELWNEHERYLMTVSGHTYKNV